MPSSSAFCTSSWFSVYDGLSIEAPAVGDRDAAPRLAAARGCAARASRAAAARALGADRARVREELVGDLALFVVPRDARGGFAVLAREALVALQELLDLHAGSRRAIRSRCRSR